jgi:hypothetical protein
MNIIEGKWEVRTPGRVYPVVLYYTLEGTEREFLILKGEDRDYQVTRSNGNLSWRNSELVRLINTSIYEVVVKNGGAYPFVEIPLLLGESHHYQYPHRIKSLGRNPIGSVFPCNLDKMIVGFSPAELRIKRHPTPEDILNAEKILEIDRLSPKIQDNYLVETEQILYQGNPQEIQKPSAI